MNRKIVTVAAAAAGAYLLNSQKLLGGNGLSIPFGLRGNSAQPQTGAALAKPANQSFEIPKHVVLVEDDEPTDAALFRKPQAQKKTDTFEDLNKVRFTNCMRTASARQENLEDCNTAHGSTYGAGLPEEVAHLAKQEGVLSYRALYAACTPLVRELDAKDRACEIQDRPHHAKTSDSTPTETLEKRGNNDRHHARPSPSAINRTPCDDADDHRHAPLNKRGEDWASRKPRPSASSRPHAPRNVVDINRDTRIAEWAPRARPSASPRPHNARPVNQQSNAQGLHNID